MFFTVFLPFTFVLFLTFTIKSDKTPACQVFGFTLFLKKTTPLQNFAFLRHKPLPRLGQEFFRIHAQQINPKSEMINLENHINPLWKKSKYDRTTAYRLRQEDGRLDALFRAILAWQIDLKINMEVLSSSQCTGSEDESPSNRQYRFNNY